MPSGRVSRLMPGRGIGFIEQTGATEEYMFHWSAITAGHLDQLHVGQTVEFELEPDQRDSSRQRAIRVRLLDSHR